MEALINLLLTLIGKIGWLSEQEKEDATEGLRKFEEFVGVKGVVPPKAGDANQPAPPPPDVPVPGPVAEPVPPDQQPPPPTGMPGAVEETPSPEQTNAFTQQTAPGESSVPPDQPT